MNPQRSADITVASNLVPELTSVWAVVVGAAFEFDGVAAVDCDGQLVHAGPLDGGEPVPLWQVAQPGQGWVIVGDQSLLASELVALGAHVEVVPDSTDIPTALLRHACRARVLAEAITVEATTEVTVLRREMNKALSALSSQHPILGLAPSATLDELRAERWPEQTSSDARSLMLLRPNPSAAAEAELRGEIARLHDHISAVENTRLWRWSSAPRRVYRKLR